ncbi:MAG TPA: nicotinate-nucleotide adenylyltransferase [Steroidobacteraceae bacterium]|jgi:nicotinate-nucleotide adenylyltransferase|nr:nicotinate-nucleotide adenylyltransferase [Steroidobacteraceae bacterium]
MTGGHPPAPIGVFGGTFDPIHYGHLRTAYEVLQALRLREVRFVPAGDPPHRDPPRVDAAIRLELVRAATADQPGFVVDDREVRRAGPSYTVLTLGELRAEMPSTPLCLIVGMDAFRGLPTWHRWQELLELAHVVVAPRPGWDAPREGPLGELLVSRRVASVEALHERASGRIYVQPVTQLEISSSELRELLAAGRDPRYLVPDTVRELVRRTDCYSASQPTR